MKGRILAFMCAALAAGIVDAAAQARPPQPPRPPATPATPAPPVPPAARTDERGGEQTERITRKIRLGANGVFTLSNIAGTIVITGASGDELTIDALKRVRGSRADLQDLRVDIDERPGRVEVSSGNTGSRFGGWRGGSVDFTVSVPTSTTVEVHSISGDINVSRVDGSLRVEAVSGNLTVSSARRLEMAKAVSGRVSISDVGSGSDVTLGTVSGAIDVKKLNARGIDASTVSGDITFAGTTSDRFDVKTVSGSVEYDGTLARNGRYDVNSHSGDVRFVLPSGVGYELDANTFSGDISAADEQSGSRRNARFREGRRAVRVRVGDGSARLTIHTFSGNVVITGSK